MNGPLSCDEEVSFPTFLGSFSHVHRIIHETSKDCKSTRTAIRRCFNNNMLSEIDMNKLSNVLASMEEDEIKIIGLINRLKCISESGKIDAQSIFSEVKEKIKLALN